MIMIYLFKCNKPHMFMTSYPTNAGSASSGSTLESNGRRPIAWRIALAALGLRWTQTLLISS